jgi:hypothetical protein
VVALLSAPFYVEDQQVVSHLAAHLRARGLVARLVAPHQLRWAEGRASVETARYREPVDAIVRFYRLSGSHGCGAGRPGRRSSVAG